MESSNQVSPRTLLLFTMFVLCATYAMEGCTSTIDPAALYAHDDGGADATTGVHQVISCADIDLGSGVHASYLWHNDDGVMSTEISVLPGDIPSAVQSQDWLTRWVVRNSGKCLGDFKRGECHEDINLYFAADCGKSCVERVPQGNTNLHLDAELGDNNLPILTLTDIVGAWPDAPKNVMAQADECVVAL